MERVGTYIIITSKYTLFFKRIIWLTYFLIDEGDENVHRPF